MQVPTSASSTIALTWASVVTVIATGVRMDAAAFETTFVSSVVTRANTTTTSKALPDVTVRMLVASRSASLVSSTITPNPTDPVQ